MARLRPKSIEVYLHQGIPEDDMICGVWDVLKKNGRRQEFFRLLLLTGLMSLFEDGVLPQAVMDIYTPVPKKRRQSGVKKAPTTRIMEPTGFQLAPKKDDDISSLNQVGVEDNINQEILDIKTAPSPMPLKQSRLGRLM